VIRFRFRVDYMFENTEKYIDESRQGEVLILETDPSPGAEAVEKEGKKIFLESYGCQMNFSDSEVVASIMSTHGFSTTKDIHEADAIFINTCAIRDNAEQRVRTRLKDFNILKKNKPELLVGVLGCMAERLKQKFLEEEKIVDIVAGPDAYRDLPKLVASAESGQKAVNVFLSREETYADISPVRLDSNGVSAFITIMRGCDNMCSFCVVPFTRGRERSRSPLSIIEEAQDLVNRGYKEVTLLGQNVDSYKWDSPEGEHVNFSGLLERVALVDPSLRVRFSTSHPKDITEEVVLTMAKYENICNYIHLPVQSGSSRVLNLMNRTYDREWYLNRVKMIRGIVPDMGLSSDVISGFCSETEEDHAETLSLMDEVSFNYAYMFMYSERPGTPAAKKLEDDVPAEVKNRRLQEIIALQHKHSLLANEAFLGKTCKVLVEGFSKKSDQMLKGRNDQNHMVVFPKEHYKPGDYVMVKIEDCTSATLRGNVEL
jgi:tRNA-2-methylthio-N6-dimethylallyladenosine synthase